MAPQQLKDTLLNAFISVARSAAAVDRHAVECGEEQWTYGELDIISTGLAVDIHLRYGPKPVVAVVSENHPYVLAVMLATWKLGGIMAPIDRNVPRDIMERMLLNIGPTFVLVPFTEQAIQNVVEQMSLVVYPYNPKTATITSLMQRFLDQSPELSAQEYPVPTPHDIALYLHTSSASSVTNVKCVPLTHESILSGSQARLSWWKRTWPQQNFDHLRILGWSPWSHVIGLSHDLGAAMILTAGCYIFAMLPSAYGSPAADKTSRFLDVCGQLLETTLVKKPTAFAGVPWVLEGFMKALKLENDVVRKGRLQEAMKMFKVFGSGGAATSAECIAWANELRIPLVLDIGMTELGGPLFHSTTDGTQGWYSKDCLLSDAAIKLVNEEGETVSTEGELVVRSRFITKGYLQYDNSPFIVEDDGTVSFRTGDIYSFVGDQRLVWRGRKEDYIQMSSGEDLDPREVEAILNNCPVILRSCVVGNNFLRTSSQVVCAIIEPVRNSHLSQDSILAEITRAVSSANRGLAPPLRISWARVLVLKDGQDIPITKKGAIFRKKLEALFGEQVAQILSRSEEGIAPLVNALDANKSAHAGAANVQGRTRDEVIAIVTRIVLETLKISEKAMENNDQATFAELGMDSAMSTLIINKLNRELDLSLPLNTCHTHVDLISLTNAILSTLGLDGPSTKIRPTTRITPPGQEKEEIVIVGQSIRLPGDIYNLETFWKALVDQRDDIMTTVPPHRWDHSSFYRAPDSKNPPGPCDITLERAGFIEYESFDHTFFGISSAEAFYVPPNIRLILELAFEALENANIPPSKLKGSNTGVFVAACMEEGFLSLLFEEKGWGAFTRFYGTGVATSTACGRLSYLLDVHGPSMTIDTACSAGLIAFNQAVQYLQSGEGESAIVCGANTHAWPGTLGFLSAQKMTSVNSRCATYTNMADGYVPAEAAAGLVLKTKSAALRDGDKILAVVKSTDAKSDGRSQGLVAPNVKAQIAMQISLLEKAGFAPSQIDFIEAHGTGTSLGDLIEIQGINEVFESSHAPDRPLVVGAAKSCVGHAELVAGLVGVVKALGTFASGVVPGLVQLTHDNMNPSLDCTIVPLHLPVDTATLKTENGLPLRGLVLSNGFAGSIAGTILEAPSETMQPQPTVGIPESTPMIFVVSGKSHDALSEYLQVYLDFCLNAPASLFHSLCYTSCVGREHHRYRFACIAHNMQDLIARIEDRLQNTSPPPSGNARRILLAFPGQGSQYQGMGRSLAMQYSGFRSIITEAANKAAALTGYPILPYVLEESAPGHLSIDQSEVAQVCIFIFQYAMATWLETLGVHAHAVMGHSLGEIAAAVVGRAFTFELGLQFVVVRSKLLRADPANPGGMVAIAASEERVISYIDKLALKERVAVAVYNGSDAIVVSGELVAVDQLMAAVKRDGLRSTKLNIDQGFHSPTIAHALPALKAWVDEHEQDIRPLDKAFFSTLRGMELPRRELLSSAYWVEHAQKAVRFIQTARAAHGASSIDILVDVGPQPTIWSNMQTAEFIGKPRLAMVGKKGKDQVVAMLSALSSLFEKGFNVDFEILLKQMPYKFVKTDLPTYPFQRLHNYPGFRATRNSVYGAARDQVESVVQVKPVPAKFVVDQALCDFLDLHRIEGRRVLPGAAMVDFFARSTASRTVKSIRFHTPLILDTPATQVRSEIDGQGAYKLIQEDLDNTPICSGSVAERPNQHVSKKVDAEPEVIPSQMMSKAQVYQCFKNVQFGEPFRTIQEVRIWSNHADGDIRVEATEHPAHDRIRKLDACLHMFGAISSRVAPKMDDTAGAYLPASLEDFTLHTDDIPYNFTCRYKLPLEVGRNARLLTASFEVFAEDGTLLVSCNKYSVAWVPRGVVHKEQKVTAGLENWIRNGWAVKDLPYQGESPAHVFDELVYLGNGSTSRVLSALASSAKDVVSVGLPGLTMDGVAQKGSNVKSISRDQLETLPSVLRGQDMLIVLDLTKSNNLPGTEGFMALHLQILAFLKVIISSKLRITNFVALTSSSAPVDIRKEGFDLYTDKTALTLVGSVIQGMVRVFRRESGLDFAAWCLDLPDAVTTPQLPSIVHREIQARYRSAFSDTFVSYRKKASDHLALSRLVPALEKIDGLPPKAPSGTTVIIGMGSIGMSLAAALVASGCGPVIFFGRRAESHEQVKKDLAGLPERARKQCHYRQVDVCDKTSLKKTLTDINIAYGGIKNIVHTAAVVKDSTIKATNSTSFTDVLRPKVIGSWNLHEASLELDLALDSFVLCSSTNVIVGNPGQIAYVAANSFMDTLATFRHNCGLPGTSLQLGAWESKLITNVDMNNSFAHLMKNDEGLPLMMKAMMSPVPVQIIARMDVKKLRATPAYAKDPFFAPLLVEREELKASSPAAESGKKDEAGAKMSKDEAQIAIVNILRVALELQPGEQLDLADSLTACGADSITFAQFKGQVLKDFEVDVPMVYLSDTYSIGDMVNYVLETYGAA